MLAIIIPGSNRLYDKVFMLQQTQTMQQHATKDHNLASSRYVRYQEHSLKLPQARQHSHIEFVLPIFQFNQFTLIDEFFNYLPSFVGLS